MFTTRAEADAAAEAIYSNMVSEINSLDLLNVNTGEVVLKDNLSPDQAVQVGVANRHYPVFGVNALSKQKDEKQGYTTAWAIPEETALGQFVFPKPEDYLMDGVIGYSVEPFNHNWFRK